ncbi:MAG: LuxR C-terminal-related transcriptional regulator [Pseudomonadota bacterium]
MDTLAEGLRIILLTAKGASKGATVDLRTALGESVSAIIPDDRSIDALIGALAVVQEGYSLVPQRTIADAQATLVSQKLRQREPFMGDHLGKLSARENMILSRLTSGDSNKDIANDLGICETTVKVHLRTCYQKIGASNRTQAAVWAVLHL